MVENAYYHSFVYVTNVGGSSSRVRGWSTHPSQSSTTVERSSQYTGNALRKSSFSVDPSQLCVALRLRNMHTAAFNVVYGFIWMRTVMVNTRKLVCHVVFRYIIIIRILSPFITLCYVLAVRACACICMCVYICVCACSTVVRLVAVHKTYDARCGDEYMPRWFLVSRWKLDAL